MHYLGIEIGGTKLQLVAGNAMGQILDRRRFVVDRSTGGEGIRQKIAEALPSLIATWKPRAIGVGFGGPVNAKSGQICCSHQIQGWHDFPLGTWLHELSGVPVSVDNDANIAALGEAHQGAGRGRSPVFYVTLGSGVGGGLVVDGAVYHGAIPGEVEIGHVRLDRSGAIVEHRCSGWAVDRRIRSEVVRNPECFLARACGPTVGGEARHLAAALVAGDWLARQILDETTADLAFALSHVVNLFHPSCLILGGGLSLVGEPLRHSVAEKMTPWLMDAFQPGPPVYLAGLGEDSVPVGALVLAKLNRPA